MKEKIKKIFNIIQALIIVGGSFLSIIKLNHLEPNFWDYLLVVLIFISLTSIVFVFKNKILTEIKKLFSNKYPILSRIFNIIYRVIKGWLVIIFLIIILVWFFFLIKNNFFFNREACIKQYLIKTLPTIDTDAYVKDLYKGRLSIDLTFKPIAVFANKDIGETKNIAKEEAEKYWNRGIYYGEKVIKIGDLSDETKEYILQNLDYAAKERTDITKVLGICVKQ